MMQDLMLMDRQVNYRKWSRAHDLVEDEDLEDEVIEQAKNYLGTF